MEARRIELTWNEHPSNEYIIEVLKHESVYALGVLAMEIMIGYKETEEWIRSFLYSGALFELSPHPCLCYDEGCSVNHWSDV